MLSHALLHQPQHQVLASADLDHTRTAVGRCMKPHGLSVRGRGQALRARMHHLAMGRVSLSRLHYGAPVQIEPDRLEGFYLVQMPLAGTADGRCGGQHIQSTPELASVLSPQQPVASALLDSQPHQADADAAPRNPRALMPRHVRRVQEHLHAHADEPISADQLASLAGVSQRSLYAGFSACLGMGPMHYLRTLRLDRARADLQTGRGTVASVALHWGFAHLGRFSADYRQRFGEHPSDTLRKA